MLTPELTRRNNRLGLVLAALFVAIFVGACLIAIVYLQARQRSRIVSMALSERMGLQEGTMRRSLVVKDAARPALPRYRSADHRARGSAARRARA